MHTSYCGCRIRFGMLGSWSSLLAFGGKAAWYAVLLAVITRSCSCTFTSPLLASITRHGHSYAFHLHIFYVIIYPGSTERRRELTGVTTHVLQPGGTTKKGGESCTLSSPQAALFRLCAAFATTLAVRTTSTKGKSCCAISESRSPCFRASPENFPFIPFPFSFSLAMLPLSTCGFCLPPLHGSETPSTRRNFFPWEILL
jgi:hypothetical protein